MYCVDRATFYFGARVSEIYATKYHGEQTKVASQSLIEDLRSSFSTLINEAQWMDEGITALSYYLEYSISNEGLFSSGTLNFLNL